MNEVDEMNEWKLKWSKTETENHPQNEGRRFNSSVRKWIRENPW